MRTVLGILTVTLLLAGSVGAALTAVKRDARASDQCSRFHMPRPESPLAVDYAQCTRPAARP